MAEAIFREREGACPFERAMSDKAPEIEQLLGRHQASPFDLPLIYLSRWSECDTQGMN
jgi:hypothetical protein